MNNYLPVNPCCTEVVSTTNCNQVYQISNYGCVKNICKSDFPVTSDIIYNGIELTCTLISPCDTMSVVLQKIDAILCSLNSQIISLTEQIEELTISITEAEENITIIFGILENCCTTTTTTSLIPTTTTTTTISCNIVNISGSESTTGIWTATKCDISNELVGGTVVSGGTTTTPCIVVSTLVMVNCSIKDISPCI
jgi:hypothetical protein